ncbi:hypothetical protein GMPD_08320 [Geomonas paludis]|uniref:Uncharacterized protein n=1 Tax=Geomonas paludis TaxID=2740185 RepID=A0A6V8MTG5_9BACT|nr:hypothetical protein GMPD_08320 [Geomonas paludis]
MRERSAFPVAALQVHAGVPGKSKAAAAKLWFHGGSRDVAPCSERGGSRDGTKEQAVHGLSIPPGCIPFSALDAKKPGQNIE